MINVSVQSWIALLALTFVVLASVWCAWIVSMIACYGVH